jgi:UDP-N-acetylglucosamine--N-acetylmuramyl-(pentapeptide) pyrophosphoryl-undecaprenol N-acetylglucosamine transferase
VNRAPVTPPMIAVFGGSLGARQLNDATLELYERWRDRTDVSIVHLTGTRDHERCTARLDELRRPSDRLAFAQRAYEDHMVNVYSTAAMVVCRAGAITIAELAASGMPAVVVPLPNAPHDHQTRNGEALARLGAAVLVPDEELDGPRLDRELRRLLDDPALLVTMGHAGKGIARPDAAARVADMVEAAGHAA